MGGHALKNTYTERKTTGEFNKIASEIIPIIKSNLPFEPYIVKCYRNKETHGDMDILLKIPSYIHISYINNMIIEFINKYLKPNEIYVNEAISFDYDKFQIDLIPYRDINWEVAKVWINYDPTGNIMGKLAQQFNLKYGWDGLYYVLVMDNGLIKRHIFISRDNAKIFEFLGYDLEKFQRGFDTLEEIYDYVIESKYFNPDIFKMENLNRLDRKRNIRRNTYHSFLEYIENIPNKYEFKDNYIQEINDFFPESNLIDNINHFNQINPTQKEIFMKFNRNVIKEKFPNLGKNAMEVMKKFSNSMEDFQLYLIENPVDKVIEDFRKFIF